MDIANNLENISSVMMAREYPLYLNWEALSSVDITLSLIDKSTQVQQTLTQTIKDWESKFHVDKIVALSGDDRLSFETATNMYVIDTRGSIENALFGFLLSSWKPGGQYPTAWYFLFHDYNTEGFVQRWVFFIGNSGKGIINEFVQLHGDLGKVEHSPWRYFHLLEGCGWKRHLDWQRATAKRMYALYYDSSESGRIAKLMLSASDSESVNTNIVGHLVHEVRMLLYVLIAVFAILCIRLF